MRLTLALLLALICAPAFAESGQSGVWIWTHEPSASRAGGLLTALASAPSADRDDPSRLVARCFSGRTELLVGGAGGWGLPRRKLEVTMAIDDGPAETSLWDVSTDGRAVFLADGVEALLKRLPDDGRLRVSVRDATGQTRENLFPTAGFGVVRAKLAEACGWKD